MDEEIWKPCPTYERLYEVSNLGRVRRKPHIMKKSWSTQNFVICTLTRTGHDVNVPVHRLVAKAFVPNPHNLKNVGFLDGDHWNVRADNLQWCNQWQIKGGRIYYDENGVEMPWVREKYDD